MTRSRLALVAVVAAVLSVADVAQAHPLRFGALHLRARDDGVVHASLRFSGAEGDPSRVVPVLPEHCEQRSPPVLARRGQVRRWVVDCGSRGLAGATIEARGLGKTRAQLLVRVDRPNASHRRMLDATTPRFRIPSNAANADVFGRYLVLGMEHIATGFDHLLFVLGLMLLVGWRWKLAATVTAFTAGHSITLALAVLGTVRFPTAPIEAVIGLSIVLLAVELARGTTRPTWTRTYPWIVAGAFGLLHGFGFAGALSSAGLPEDAIPQSLLAFNIGVEVGQLAFIAVVGAAWLGLRNAIAHWPRLAWPALPYAIGTIASFWSIERIVGFF